MMETLQSALSSIQNNQLVLLLFSGGIVWTLFSNIRSIFSTVWSGVLACISFTVNSVTVGDYDIPLANRKITKVFSDSKVLWERHSELQNTSSDWDDSRVRNSAYGRSIRWMLGHFVILDRTYSTNSTKVVTTLTARVFFARRSAFLKRLMKEIERCSLTDEKDTITVSMGKGICTEKPKRSIDTVYSNDGTPQRMLSDIRAFIANRELYVNGSSPYKFVALLTGEPGTGKTSAIHAIASELGMGVRFVNTDDEEFEDIARLMVQNGDEEGGRVTDRKIIVIEDVDCMSMNATECRWTPSSGHGKGMKVNIEDGDSESMVELKKSFAIASERSERGNPTSISLTSILNLLDGIITPTGCIVFLTSNNPEKLDPALLRDGRIDSRYEFGKLNGKTAAKMVSDYLKVDAKDLADGTSPSSLQRDILKVSIGRMKTEELLEKYSEGKIPSSPQ